MKIRLIEDNSVDPICPHCNRPLDSIHTRRIESTLGVRYVYCCSDCRKVLGISHRKGFWMG